ncbi:hypothetical protein C8263_18240 [Deinococcus arcticus]|uniref:Tyr recombinase domain-containing protein n=2 Tax=Deinococcus arcticus TaxID=2136176 RepID=A0A2T3W3C0_9DEIO|nr:hypothetical protein C8263_18240 [Deinococcus arcticus]
MAVSRHWVSLTPEERRRRALEAARDLDEAVLLDLLQAHRQLFGPAGARTSPQTQRTYTHGVRAFLGYVESSTGGLLRLSSDEARLWIRMLEAKRSASTVTVYLAAARALMAALRWAGALKEDVFLDARPGRNPTAPWERRRPYSESDFSTLLDCADIQDRVMLLLGGHAGLRVAESTALVWADLDLSARQLTVQHGKGGKRRQVTLSRRLIKALEEWRALAATDEPRILPYTTTRARQRLKALAEQADVPYLGTHALRHTAGARLYKATKNLEDVARHLGHSGLETARIYAKWDDEHLRRVVDEW